MTTRPLDLTACPEPGCDAPAEVVDRYEMPSTAGAVAHVATVCVRKHHRVHTTN